MTQRHDTHRRPSFVQRLINPDAAAFVHELNTDTSFIAYVCEVRGTVVDQCNWITPYKVRESVAHEP